MCRLRLELTALRHGRCSEATTLTSRPNVWVAFKKKIKSLHQMTKTGRTYMHTKRSIFIGVIQETQLEETVLVTGNYSL